MKRIITAAVFALMISLSAFAEVVIEAEGRGETIEEAKENAIIALAEKVFPNTVVAETGTQTTDGDDGYSSFFSQKSSRSVVGEFPGIDYKEVSNKKNNCIVSTEIRGDESTIAYYTDRLEEEKTSAEEFYQRYISYPSTESATTRRKELARVIEHYYYFNIYSNIILRLGGSPEDIDIPTTIAVLQVDYESLLAEEEIELTSRSNVSSITKEIAEELKKNREAQEAYKKAQEESNAQAELQRKLLLDQRISEIISSGETVDLQNVSSLVTLEGFSNYLDVIQSANYYLAEASNQYDSLVEEQNDYIEESFAEEAEAIRNRTYPLAYLSNGKPTEAAISLREEEVQALREQKDKEKKEALATINEKLCSEIQKRYNYLYEAEKAFSEIDFCVYSKNDEVRFSSTPTWDGYKYGWTFSVQMDSPVVFVLNGLVITYTDLTGKKIPTDKAEFKAFYGSTEFQDTIDAYDTLLKEGGCEFSVSFRAEVDLSGYLSVTLEELTMTFKDGKVVTLSLTDVKTKKISLGFDESSYLSYSWLDRTPDKTDEASSATSTASASTAAQTASSAKTAAEKYSTSSAAQSAMAAMERALNGNSSITSSKVSTTTSSTKTTQSTEKGTTSTQSVTTKGEISSAESSAVEASPVSVAEPVAVVKTVKSGGKNRFSFSLSTQCALDWGSIYTDEVQKMIEVDAEFRLFYSVFFAGCNMQYSCALQSAEDGAKLPFLNQMGVYPVLGVRLFDRIVIACRTGYNKSNGIMINPYATVSLKFFMNKSSSLRNSPVDVTLMGGCYIAPQTGMTVAAFGVSFDYDFNM